MRNKWYLMAALLLIIVSPTYADGGQPAATAPATRPQEPDAPSVRDVQVMYEWHSTLGHMLTAEGVIGIGKRFGAVIRGHLLRTDLFQNAVWYNNPAESSNLGAGISARPFSGTWGTIGLELTLGMLADRQADPAVIGRFALIANFADTFYLDAWLSIGGNSLSYGANGVVDVLKWFVFGPVIDRGAGTGVMAATRLRWWIFNVLAGVTYRPFDLENITDLQWKRVSIFAKASW